MSDEPVASADDQHALAGVRWNWEAAYDISCPDRPGGPWTARFKGDNSTLSAGSANDLRRLLRADYLSRKSAAASMHAAGSFEFEPGDGERALRRLMDDGVI